MAGAYRRLTHRQRRFVQALTETNDTRESALLANYASEATGATLVRSNRDIRAILAFQAQGAVDRIETLSINAENEGVRLNANKDIMDRAGYKPIEQVQNTTINLEVRQPNTEELETIRLKYERELYNKLAEPKQNE